MSDPVCHPVWSWDLGDGTTPAPTTPVVDPHSYKNSWSGKTVHVKLKVTNDAGTILRPVRYRAEMNGNHNSRRVAGQALVEFALVLPIFMLMLFGLIDGGRYVYS